MFRQRHFFMLLLALATSINLAKAEDAQTTIDEEVEQTFQFRCLDPNYRHAKALPLVNKIVGLPFSASGERLSKEVDARVKKFRETHPDGSAIAEARAVLEVDDSVSDAQVKRRAELVNQTLAIDPAYIAEHPHGTRNTFLLFPAND